MKRLIKQIVTALFAVICIFALASCGTGNGRHEHVFGSSWSFDDNSHYRVCLDCKEEVRGAHLFYGDSCRVCGYKPNYSVSLAYEGVYEDGELVSCTVNGIGSCKDSHVIIPEKLLGVPVTKIAANAFKSCAFIENLTIFGGVREIGANAFFACANLKTVNMPDCVQTLGANAFASCAKLQNLGISGGVALLPNGIFTGCTALESVNIPDGVEKISALAFQSCTKLKSVRFGKTVSSIDAQAFLGCSSLEAFSVAEDNATYKGENNCIIEKADNKLAFAANNAIVTVPAGVEVIGGAAFYICAGVEEIYLPASVVEVEPSAFIRCNALVRVRYGGTAEDWNKIKFNVGNDKLTSAQVIFETQNNG